MSDKQSRFEALKAAFGKKNEKGNVENSAMWDKFYPFFKMNFDETAEIRFLPDLDAQNPLLFVIQNVYHILEII